jgi:hypothetical protein
MRKLLVVLAVVACGGMEPAAVNIAAAKGAPGGGGAGGGGPPQTDGPAWGFSALSIDFTRQVGQTLGGIPVAATRTTELIVTNTSKKTVLTVSSISFTGANPGDFLVDALSQNPLPANQNAAGLIHVTFKPTAPGARTATLLLISNAGSATIAVNGIGLPERPVISPNGGSLQFLPTSAFDTISVENLGGQSLSLDSISISGPFQFVGANAGFSNCFAGVLIGPNSLCFIGVGLAPDAVAPASGDLVIVSNDPTSPTVDIPLTLVP